MPTIDLRPCSFCAHEALTLVAMGNDSVQRVSVVCMECGAVGPMATADDTPGYAAFLWNQRYGAN
jgi:hypothetical protein